MQQTAEVTYHLCILAINQVYLALMNKYLSVFYKMSKYMNIFVDPALVEVSYCMFGLESLNINLYCSCRIIFYCG